MYPYTDALNHAVVGNLGMQMQINLQLWYVSSMEYYISLFLSSIYDLSLRRVNHLEYPK